MKDTLKDSSIYLFNAYSNQNPEVSFISGSDRVGLELIKNETSSVYVLGPRIFKKQVPPYVNFIETELNLNKNLYLSYFIRTFNTLIILFKLGKKSDNIRIISTSDFFPDVIPPFLYFWKFKWFAFTYHLYPLKLNFRDLLGRALQVISYLLFLVSCKVVTTSSECENFLKKNFRFKRILKINLGINLDSYFGQKISKDSSLVYLGRIKKSKGVFDLPEIIFNIKREHPNVLLKIIGNGSNSDLEILNNTINTYSLKSNIKVLANLNDIEVISELAGSYCLLQPSYEEGFGLAVLEGLAANLKVISYNLPVYQDHFNEFDITYVPLGDRLSFSEALKNELSNIQTINYPQNLFEKFSWNFIYNKIFRD